jgi:hypothetical protein
MNPGGLRRGFSSVEANMSEKMLGLFVPLLAFYQSEQDEAHHEWRKAALSDHLGREARLGEGLDLAGWAELPHPSGSGFAIPTADLSWVVYHSYSETWMRAFADALESILPVDADPRSRAVIPALRSGVVDEGTRVRAFDAWREAREETARLARACALAGAGLAAAAAAGVGPQLDPSFRRAFLAALVRE